MKLHSVKRTRKRATRTRKEKVQAPPPPVVHKRRIDPEKLQAAIDKTAYPPTHLYDVGSMTPYGPLAERVPKILNVCPKLFTGDSFLDVGANKGFFSMLAAKGCRKVVAVERDAECCAILRSLPAKNITVEECGFDEFQTDEAFDRVFIGNVHHHIYRQCGGWDWIGKLVAISTDLVVIEGPVGLECGDMQRIMPDELRPDFNRETFLQRMCVYFDYTGEVPSPPYTPDRYIMAFKRRGSE